MKCFWCENRINKNEERYLIVEIDEGTIKAFVCEECILNNEVKKIDEFLNDYPNWLEKCDKDIILVG